MYLIEKFRLWRKNRRDIDESFDAEMAAGAEWTQKLMDEFWAERRALMAELEEEYRRDVERSHDRHSL